MKPRYEIWLTVNNNKDRLQLPVNPSSINIDSGTQNTTVNISGLGEVTILQDPVAKIFEFSSFFPLVYGPYCETIEIPKPWDAVNFIEKYKNEQPFRFIITNTPINILVSIEDFKYLEQAGDVGTIHYSLRVKEYRIVAPRELTVAEANVVLQVAARPAPPSPKTYTVVSGDFLSKIARKLGLKDWKVIYNANKDKIKDPSLIYPGQVLTIP